LHRLRGAARAVEMGGTFHLLTCIEGAVDVRDEAGNAIRLSRGQSAFMPAGLKCFTLSGVGEVLRAW
jgi:mannose-6-phosphate isomerase class I